MFNSKFIDLVKKPPVSSFIFKFCIQVFYLRLTYRLTVLICNFILLISIESSFKLSFCFVEFFREGPFNFFYFFHIISFVSKSTAFPYLNKVTAELAWTLLWLLLWLSLVSRVTWWLWRHFESSSIVFIINGVFG